jgi:hypothetical protein
MIRQALLDKVPLCGSLRGCPTFAAGQQRLFAHHRSGGDGTPHSVTILQADRARRTHLGAGAAADAQRRGSQEVEVWAPAAVSAMRRASPLSQVSMEVAAILPERIASSAVRGPCCPSPPAKTLGTLVILVFGSATMKPRAFSTPLRSRLAGPFRHGGQDRLHREGVVSPRWQVEIEPVRGEVGPVTVVDRFS